MVPLVVSALHAAPEVDHPLLPHVDHALGVKLPTAGEIRLEESFDRLEARGHGAADRVLWHDFIREEVP